MNRYGYEVRKYDGIEAKTYAGTLATDYQIYSKVEAQRIAKQCNRESKRYYRHQSVKYIAVKYG